MSKENVEIVRRHIDAYRSGQWAAALTAYHPEVVCDTRALPEGRIYRGRDGVAQSVSAWVGTWADWQWEIEELIDAGDRVLMVIRESGRGKASGVHVDQQTVWIYRLRDGQIIHATVMVDRDTALEAAGLRE